MAKMERASPMNNNSFESISGSPNFLNLSDSCRFLSASVQNFRRSFSPLAFNSSKSPNLSPIVSKTPQNLSPFIKKRDRKQKNINLTPHKEKFDTFQLNENINEITLSVKAILKDLNLTEYLSIFEEEEIYLDVFFTISDNDLKAIGIKNKEHRQKLLDFIKSFSTPKKNACQASIKNALYRC